MPSPTLTRLFARLGGPSGKDELVWELANELGESSKCAAPCCRILPEALAGASVSKGGEWARMNRTGHSSRRAGFMWGYFVGRSLRDRLRE